MPDWVIAILTNEAFLAILFSIVGSIVAWAKTTEMWGRHKSKRKELALEIMQAAALALVHIAEKYKRDSADGTLHQAAIKDLNEKFADEVAYIGRKMGIDVAKLVPGVMWDMFRHFAVEKVKGRKKLPASVERMLK